MRLTLSLMTLLVASVALAADEGSRTINLADPPPGLDTRPLDIEVVEAFPNIRIARPVVITNFGDGSNRVVVGSQFGQIYVLPNDPNAREPQLMMDISDRVTYKENENEEGFLGLAFHPDFENNREFFVYYTSSAEPHLSVISRFRASEEDETKGLPESEEQIMTIQQPFWNHNGGTIIFGPDGYLYVGLGDGGKANDPLQAGQDPSQILGSILRIDVDNRPEGHAYGIPPDNPFVGVTGARPEIYAIGVRNIWRMEFDPKTGTLWAADVGQNLWEEVNVIEKGGNYGWSLREGGHAFDLHPTGGSPPRPALIDPLVEYPHTDDWGKSVTGGAVWRSKRLPQLDGWYLYGDYVTGKLWALNYDEQNDKVLANRPIEWQGLPVFTFGQTEDGEVLMSTMMSGGRIYRFVDK